MPKKADTPKPPVSSKTYKLADLPDFERIPTGMAAMDLFTSGGIPLGTNSLFSGAPSSGKTVTVTAALANYLRRFPKSKCLYINADNKLTKDGLALRQGDGSRVETIYPDTAEDAEDVVLNTADKRKDVGIVIIDSLASLTSDKEVLGGDEMGVLAKAHNKFIRKFTAVQVRRAVSTHPLTLWIINQERRTIGLYATRYVPGGTQQTFQAALWVEFDKADNHIDKKTQIPIADTFRYHFRKNEGGAKGWSGETRMATTPHGHWRVGDFIDHEFTFLWAKRLGLLRLRKDQGYQSKDKIQYQEDWIAEWENTPETYHNLKIELTQAFIAWRKSELQAKFLSGTEESADSAPAISEEASNAA